MTTPPRIMQLTCDNCSEVSICGPAEVVSRLRSAGMFRREKEPDQILIAELLRHAADRLICAQCGHKGLSVAPLEDELSDEAWGAVRSCGSCGKPIPSERVELFPNVTLCVECQRVEEAGGGAGEEEYCLKCGAVMTLRRRSGRGITGYEMRCPECGAR